MDSPLLSFNLQPGITSEQLALRRRLAEHLLIQGSDSSPVQSWTQGLARVTQSLVGGMDAYYADQADKQRRADSQKLIAGLFGLNDNDASTAGVGGAAGGQPSPTVAPVPASSAGGAPAPAIAPPASTVSPAEDAVSGFVRKNAMAESSGDANATNPRSTATGPNQFLASTWLQQVRKDRPDLAEGKSRREILNMRTDPALSAQMTAGYARDNGAFLTQAGVPVNDGTLYLAHVFGPEGARLLAKSDPSLPAAGLLGPAVINANPWIAGKTAGDLVQFAQTKMAAPTSPSVLPVQSNAGAIPASAAAPSAAPQGLGGAGPISPVTQRKIRQAVALVSSDDPTARAMGQSVLSKIMGDSDQTPEIKNYAQSVQQGYKGSFFDYQMELKKAGAQQTNINMGENALSKEIGGGVGKQITEGRQAALDASQSLQSNAEARDMLNKGMITGFGANFKLGMGKMLQQVGYHGSDDAIANTESYMAQRVAETGRLIKMFGAGTGLSDNDRAYAAAAAAGKIDLNETSIRKILDINERAATNVISQHNANVDRLKPGTVDYDLRVPMPNKIPEARPGAKAALAPAPGTVVKGYKFLGGDPSKQESWAKVQ